MEGERERGRTTREGEEKEGYIKRSLPSSCCCPFCPSPLSLRLHVVVCSYKQNGVLAMLDRNKRIKLAPEKFQTATAERFHVVITCESRIFDEVLRGASLKFNSFL